MKKKLFTIAIILLSNLLYFTVSGQYKSVEMVSKTFVETNKNVLKRFFQENDEKVKILVLPFINSEQKPDELSDNIAREISSLLQQEFQKRNDIMIVVKDEFDGENNKTLEGYRTEKYSNKYYENLLEKFKPNYCIFGNYSMEVNNIGQDIVKLQSVNIKNYYYNSSQKIQKKGLIGCSAVIPSSDKTIDIKTKHFIWAEGQGRYYEKAESQSLKNLKSKISANLQTRFLTVKPTDIEISEFSKNIMKSYNSLLSEKIKSRTISEEDGNCEIIKYISKDILAQIFDERELAVKDYLTKGLQAEEQTRIGDALLNYYRALILVQTHPGYAKLRFNFGNGAVKMSSAIPERIRTITRNTKFTINKSEKISQKITRYTINIKYKGKLVQNIVYKYWTGNGYSSHVHATNGTGIIELFGTSAQNSYNLKCKIEYMFADRNQEDRAYAEALDVISPPRFPEANIKLSGSNEKTDGNNSADYSGSGKPKNKSVNNEKTDGNNSADYSDSGKPEKVVAISSGMGEAGNLNVKSAREIIKKIKKAIKTKQYDSVKKLFNTEGFEMYTKLIKYGKAKVISNNNFTLVKMNNRNVFRSVTMQFTFGNKIFIENVNFTFNKENKISSVSFALSDESVNNIMETEWPEFDKFELLCFMENYKTAYQLKNMKYIESVFSDNALIIVGHVLKTAKNTDPEFQKVSYKRFTKKEYLKRLENNFSRSNYVNLRFEETKVTQAKMKHVYGIQLNQIYSSSNYADKGYLFLLVDLRNPQKPKIHVRTWQPEKNPDGSIFNTDDFPLK